MLSSDLDTVQATRLLFEEIGRANNPVTIWAGAGTSAWCGYPLWPELAKIFHSKFARYEKPHYGAKEGLALLNAGRFPELFQKCRAANAQRYNSLLTSSFYARQPSAVYQRFVRAIMDLFLSLATEEHHLDFPVLYGSGREGFVSEDSSARSGDLRPLLDTILKYIPAPVIEDAP